MKKLFISLFFVSVFSFGFNNTSSAALDEVACITVTVDCGDGTGTNGLACGTTAIEIATEAYEIAEAFCG